MEIRVSPRFERDYKKLPRDIKEKAKTREEIFKANAFDPRLDTYKLRGKDDGRWAYSIDYDYRIKFVFLGKGIETITRPFFVAKSHNFAQGEED